MPLRSILGLLTLSSMALGLGLDLATIDKDDEDTQEGRTILFLGGNGNGVSGFNTNLTLLATLLASLASGLLSLFTLTGLGLLAASKMNKDDHHHGGGYSSHHGTSYRRMFSPLDLDWESLSFSDWLSLLRDTWESFDPSDFECQKRFICDVHQGKEALGPMADTIIYYFSYLQYSRVMSLPDGLKGLLEEYMDAADRGRTLLQDCGDIFSECHFSVRKLLKKFSGNDVTKGDSNGTESRVADNGIASDGEGIGSVGGGYGYNGGYGSRGDDKDGYGQKQGQREGFFYNQNYI